MILAFKSAIEQIVDLVDQGAITVILLINCLKCDRVFPL
jgi:hypothetical protein